MGIILNFWMETKTFKYVSYLWDETKSLDIEGDEIALLLYRSNILGADLRITNFGGGNTSCKTIEKDPLTGLDVEVMWIKGSGGDLGTLSRNGLAGLYTDKLHALKNRYRGLNHEDEMVGLLYHCIYDLNSRAPSIDTPLHGLLPFKHIDHLHPDAVIAIAAAKDGEEITKKIWGDTIAWIPWQRPGFDLGLQLENCLKENPGIRGIVLGSHGLFTWGNTSYECYINSLDVIEQASNYIGVSVGINQPVFGGQKLKSPPEKKRKSLAAQIAPILRGFCSSENRMIGHFTDDEKVLEFINSHDLLRLALMGTSCPDHFLRTKIKPLVLPFNLDVDCSNVSEIKSSLEKVFSDYRKEYSTYYESCKHTDSPAMRDPNPVVILWPGIGMYTFAKNKQTARVASEFYINAINVMRGAEAISSYTALPRQEAFNIEYWLLEEAKLKRMPHEKTLSRKIAFITGAGGGIGRAIAERLVAGGANVVLADIVEERLKEGQQSFAQDTATFIKCDVTNSQDIERAFQKAVLEFGGVDIIVHSAGLAISKPLSDTTVEDWDLLQGVLVKGQFLLAQKGRSF